MRFISRAWGTLATLVSCALVAAACGDPDLASELNSAGSPEALEVNVRSESAAVLGTGDPSGLQAGESATYCRPGEQYKVNAVYCPLRRDMATNAPIAGDRELEGPVLDADPRTWYVRVIFDELLDPSIEELRTEDGITTGHIAESQPFVVTCGGQSIDYDGWYDPGGNHLSFPPGPGLVATFTAFVATGSVCTIELNDNVMDKDGNPVASEQRGPYDFGIAPLQVFSVDPADASEGVALDPAITVEFNAPIDLASAAGRIVLSAGATAVPGTLAHVEDEDGNVVDDALVVFTPDAPLDPMTTYTVTVSSGIADVAGGPLELEAPLDSTFTTGEAG